MQRTWQLAADGAACECYASPVAVAAASPQPCRVALIFKTAPRISSSAADDWCAPDSACPAQASVNRTVPDQPACDLDKVC